MDIISGVISAVTGAGVNTPANTFMTAVGKSIIGSDSATNTSQPQVLPQKSSGGGLFSNLLGGLFGGGSSGGSGGGLLSNLLGGLFGGGSSNGMLSGLLKAGISYLFPPAGMIMSGISALSSLTGK